MAVDKTYALQTKCKTCFGGPRMILQAHWKNTFPKKGFGFLLPSETPPGLVKDHTFAAFFSAPFPNHLIAFPNYRLPTITSSVSSSSQDPPFHTVQERSVLRFFLKSIEEKEILTAKHTLNTQQSRQSWNHWTTYGMVHTSYLSFFLHGHYFWLNFSPHNSA